MLYRIWPLLKEVYHYEKHSTLDSDYLRQVLTLAVVVLFALNFSCNRPRQARRLRPHRAHQPCAADGGVAAAPGEKRKASGHVLKHGPYLHRPAASGLERERRLPEPVVLPDAGYSFRAVGAAHRPAVLHGLRPRGHLFFVAGSPRRQHTLPPGLCAFLPRSLLVVLSADDNSGHLLQTLPHPAGAERKRDGT